MQIFVFIDISANLYPILMLMPYCFRKFNQLLEKLKIFCSYYKKHKKTKFCCFPFCEFLLWYQLWNLCKRYYKKCKYNNWKKKKKDLLSSFWQRFLVVIPDHYKHCLRMVWLVFGVQKLLPPPLHAIFFKNKWGVL